jgi:hypothetical protein
MTWERDCERLVLDYVHYNDTQNYEALSALFVPDGILVRPAGDRIVGSAAILNAYRSRPGGRITRHICTNIRITARTADRADGLSYALIYSAKADETPDRHFGVKAEGPLVGEFQDEFVRTPEGWRFQSRHARFVMHTSA